MISKLHWKYVPNNPDTDRTVLIASLNGSISKGSYHKDLNMWVGYEDFSSEDIIYAWCELPALPDKRKRLI